MGEPVSILLVAVGGYGHNYVSALLDAQDRSLARIVGVADPTPERCRRLDDLRTLGVPFCDSPEAYYARNNWAGALDDGSGTWILDSPVNNATAHYLHNLLYVMGPEVDRSLRPVSVAAELYRARDITNYDTGIARIVAADGAEMLYIASHAVREVRGPEFIYEFEQGSVRYAAKTRQIVGQLHTGETVDYGNPDADGIRKLWQAVSAVRGEQAVVCGPEAASAQTLVVNGMQESVPDIAMFPRGLVIPDGPTGERVYRVEGLDELLGKCYDAFAMPSDLGTDWAVRGKEIDLRDYTRFPGGK